MKNTCFRILLLLLCMFSPATLLASEVVMSQQQSYHESDNGAISFEDLEDEYLNLRSEFEQQNRLIENILSEEGRDQNVSAISYADWAAIILTCVAILVTVLGVLIAILSFWGYKNITKEAKSYAEMISNNASSRIAKEQVESCINDIAKEELVKLINAGELRKHFEDAIDLIYRRHGLSEGVGGFGFGEYPEFDEEDKGE